MDKMIRVVIGLTLVFGTCLTIYGSYWVAKHVSYSFFYRDMVVQTIKDNVKSESLKP